MMAVIQEEKTGCAIASSAAIAGTSYEEARKIANGMVFTPKIQSCGQRQTTYADYSQSWE
jgi:hypothetical protein